MRILRMILLTLLALIPLVTLFHFDFRGRLETQHSAMIAPDEFSYLLMARHFLQGGGLSLKQSLGLDTFYPPGYPLLLAGFALFTGGTLTILKAHIFNTLLLSLDTLIVYAFTRRLLVNFSTSGHRRFHYSRATAATLAFLITALFATNWHVLETSLFVMSEPAFMLIVFAWLTLALRWPLWHVKPLQSLAIAALAVAAWSIRGAGITCVATTILYAIACWIYDAFLAEPRVRHCPKRRSAALLLILLLPLSYQTIITTLSPEKSLTSAEESANSYPRQLLNGLTDGHHLDLSSLHAYPAVAVNLLNLMLQHLGDFAASFVPWPRENPDMHFREIIGRIFAMLALAGWLFQLLRPRFTSTPPRPSSPYAAIPAAPPKIALHFLHLFLLLYIALYLVWPFDFARFWAPIFPIMLACAADAVIRFLRSVPPSPITAPHNAPRRRLTFTPPAVAMLLLVLLLVLSAEEVGLQLGNYARRLNYVSDSLADATRSILRRVSARATPQKATIAVIGGDDHFALAWYLAQLAPAVSPHSYEIVSPLPHLAAAGGAGEHADQMLFRLASVRRPGTSLFFFSYFPDQDVRDTLRSFAERRPDTSVQKIFRKEIIVTVWQIVLPANPATASRPTPPPSPR